jgi:multidrug transporter EmrE-like cation transporter
MVYLAVFCAMQVVAQLFFKWGSQSAPRFIWGFLGGNLFGFSSIWLLMLLYKAMNPNVAMGVAMGGSFLLSQVAVMLVFKSRVAPVQWAGIAAIVIGMALLAGGMKRGTEG